MSVVAYIACIVLVNWTFVVIAPWSTPFGDLYIANVLVGFVFVLRDYGQRRIGQWILLATVLAGIITYFMVGKELAVASLTAFFISETADWAIYTFTKRPLQERILVSSAVSVPLDTLSFQYLAGYLTPAAFTTEVLSKMVGVLIVWYLLKLRLERASAAV